MRYRFIVGQSLIMSMDLPLRPEEAVPLNKIIYVHGVPHTAVVMEWSSKGVCNVRLENANERKARDLVIGQGDTSRTLAEVANFEEDER